jgi:diadenosine tetraphosphate (Ap4A) HIT family hydrolase
LYLFRYYKLELENTQDPAQRAWLLRRIRESEQEYLTLMQQEHARLERETSNMEEALRRIRAIEQKKK